MTNTMIITRGYPASGKSFYAREWVNEDPDNRVEVNRDTTRKMIGAFPVGTKEQEDTVTTINNNIVKSAIQNGKDIIVSDTNMRPKYIKNFVKMTMGTDYEIIIKDFKTDINTIRDRDKNRVDSVGEDVIDMFVRKYPYKNWMSPEKIIKDTYDQVNAKKFEPVVNNPDCPRAVIFDVDGTIATMRNRTPYDWDKVGNDSVNENIVNIMNMYRDNGYKIIIFSGRDAISKFNTKKWFKDNGITYDEFHMRGENTEKHDTRRDDIVKYEMVKNYIENKYYIETVFDDRNQVVEMWRTIFDNPTICCQVNYGDF